jgi:peptidoglycan-associated lipoprotein
MKERMKTTKVAFRTIFALALIFAATGCKTPKPGITQIPPRTPQMTAQAPEVPSARPVNLDPPPFRGDIAFPDTPGGSHAGWTENPSLFNASTVYFDLDSATVKNGEKPKVQTVAAHLKDDPSSAIRIEGHSDERGTEEYNRSLADRRDLALREELVRYFGIGPDRIDTVSYGEDRPAVAGHDEAAWKQNRRGQFILLTPPK